MSFLRWAGVATVLSVLFACSPTFNWRVQTAEGTALQALMPCKPESATRSVPLGGPSTELRMRSCEAGGLTFSLAWARVSDAAATASAIDGWRRASLAAIKADTALADAPEAQLEAVLKGADRVQGLRAMGRDHRGQPVQMRAWHFSQGPWVFQAAVYGQSTEGEAVAAFFDGLQLP